MHLNRISKGLFPQASQIPMARPDMLTYQKDFFSDDNLSVGTSGEMINKFTINNTNTERFSGDEMLEKLNKYSNSDTEHAAIVGKMTVKSEDGSTYSHFVNVEGYEVDDFGNVNIQVNDTSNTNRSEISLKELNSIDVTTSTGEGGLF